MEEEEVDFASFEIIMKFLLCIFTEIILYTKNVTNGHYTQLCTAISLIYDTILVSYYHYNDIRLSLNIEK